MDRIQLGKELQYERDKITMQYFYEKNKYQKSFNECVFQSVVFYIQSSFKT